MQSTTLTPEEKQTAQKVAEGTVFSVLIALSVTHLLNDTLQSLIPAMYPILAKSLRLDFTQVGLITLTFQMSASILQPLVGMYTDKTVSYTHLTLPTILLV